jgi:hypothetical protein
MHLAVSGVTLNVFMDLGRFILSDYVRRRA